MQPDGRLVELDRSFLADFYLDEESGRYAAVIPELPGCVSEGDSLEEARALILEAASLYLDTLSDLEAGLPPHLPPPPDELVPLQSVVLPLRDIVLHMELEPSQFIGSHISMSNSESGQVVVFPMNPEDLSATTVALLVHYAGREFLKAYEDAQEMLERDTDEESDEETQPESDPPEPGE